MGKRRTVTRGTRLLSGRMGYNYSWRLGSQYNMTVEDYEEMAEAQGWVCAICWQAPLRRLHTEGFKGRPLFIDHDHQSGRVRGLLCSQCNSMLGMAGDKPRRLERAARYLREAKRQEKEEADERINSV